MSIRLALFRYEVAPIAEYERLSPQADCADRNMQIARFWPLDCARNISGHGAVGFRTAVVAWLASEFLSPDPAQTARSSA